MYSGVNKKEMVALVVAIAELEGVYCIHPGTRNSLEIAALPERLDARMPIERAKAETREARQSR